MSDEDRSAFDPFAPASAGGSASQEVTVQFPEARWRRAGASDEQVDQLRATFDGLSADEQAAHVQHVDGVSDGDLAAELPQPAADSGADAGAGAGDTPTADGEGDGEDTASRFDYDKATAKEIQNHVGDDKRKAAAALRHEQARDTPRKTLITHLERILA